MKLPSYPLISVSFSLSLHCPFNLATARVDEYKGASRSHFVHRIQLRLAAPRPEANPLLRETSQQLFIYERRRVKRRNQPELFSLLWPEKVSVHRSLVTVLCICGFDIRVLAFCRLTTDAGVFFTVRSISQYISSFNCVLQISWGLSCNFHASRPGDDRGFYNVQLKFQNVDVIVYCSVCGSAFIICCCWWSNFSREAWCPRFDIMNTENERYFHSSSTCMQKRRLVIRGSR